MKKLVLLLTIAFISINVSAQLPENGLEGLDSLNLQLKKELNLTNKQERKWDNIYADYYGQIKSVLSDATLKPEVVTEQTRSLLDKMNTELLAILKDDQIDDFTRISNLNVRGK